LINFLSHIKLYIRMIINNDRKKMFELYNLLCKIKGEQKEKESNDCLCGKNDYIIEDYYLVCQECGYIGDICNDGNYRNDMIKKRSQSLPYHKQRNNYINRTIYKRLSGMPYKDLNNLKTIINNLNKYFMTEMRFNERKYNVNKDFIIFFVLYNMGYKDKAVNLFITNNPKQNHIILNYYHLVSMIEKINSKNGQIDI
jgi:hypothetical protein